jgi:hypothetical protein
MNRQNPSAGSPQQGDSEPLGDRGRGDKTWSPEQDEQGISNREGDQGTPASDEDGFDEDETNPSPA